MELDSEPSELNYEGGEEPIYDSHQREKSTGSGLVLAVPAMVLDPEDTEPEEIRAGHRGAGVVVSGDIDFKSYLGNSLADAFAGAAASRFQLRRGAAAAASQRLRRPPLPRPRAGAPDDADDSFRNDVTNALKAWRSHRVLSEGVMGTV